MKNAKLFIYFVVGFFISLGIESFGGNNHGVIFMLFMSFLFLHDVLYRLKKELIT